MLIVDELANMLREAGPGFNAAVLAERICKRWVVAERVPMRGHVYRIKETSSTFTYLGYWDGLHHLQWREAAHPTTRASGFFSTITIESVGP